jgi:hypothetical protein
MLLQAVLACTLTAALLVGRETQAGGVLSLGQRLGFTMEKLDRERASRNPQSYLPKGSPKSVSGIATSTTSTRSLLISIGLPAHLSI